MIITTTNTVETRPIAEYLGVVAGETVAGINAVKDFAAGIRGLVGGRSGTYEKEALKARESALQELEQRAQKMGADAVVGVHVEYTPMGQASDMLMVTATGTAVRLSS
ncbi:hypothetical protein C1Y63_02560 [Corynebacterium sp. 13CS0277]|uniref:heavy metal-binding domain-containing protein n=1 Tax=Corynebacterium sp. 13CS0277 TaxID=2071994 RepID=UPI000D036DC1|nr:heavy metal-binding domain-containing protein [Corynebacterium sp. 13CS0277]PRQ12211.1 hypothetical protein C1Y63_02560 [Corynebacterium sp. 13CS0277]